MPKVCASYEKAKENFVKNGGDLSNVSCVEDECGNIFFNFDGIDFIMTEDGDIFESESAYIVKAK